VSTPVVRVVRSNLEESVHAVDAAAVDVDGHVVAFAGDPERRAFARSSMKPLQASVSLTLSPVLPELPDREVSVMCASHNAEPVHLEAVRAILAACGVDETALRCPEFYPGDPEALAAAPQRRRINSDCSGKHSGMLGAAKANGWPLETYRSPDHPLQLRVLEAVRVASGEREPTIGVDGCGVPVHGMPLKAMATIYARLSSPDRLGDLAAQAARAAQAMRAEPYMVAGRNRVDTAVMRDVPAVIVKSGAEGMICAGLLDRGLGVAVKVRDGTHRAAGPAMIRTLSLLDALDAAALESLRDYASPPVLGGGEPVGRIVAEFDLVRP
jgi:L-asparaginase II